MRFDQVFLEIFIELWAAQPFPIPAEDELPESLVAQLRELRTALVEGQGNDGRRSAPFPPSCSELPRGTGFRRFVGSQTDGNP
jgi:hypothetical protein